MVDCTHTRESSRWVTDTDWDGEEARPWSMRPCPPQKTSILIDIGARDAVK